MRDHSRELFKKASKLMPGGVSSPVRSFAPYPIYMARGKGSYLWDVDGNRYIDYCMGFGPLILGHADSRIVSAISHQAMDGTVFGTPSEIEVTFAGKIKEHFPTMEMMRMVNSGTEATMHAIRLARGYTGRKKFIKMEGAFHGSHDAVLVKAGSGATTHCMPNSSGVPEEATANTILSPFNDAASIEKMIKEHHGEIAAVITEPLIGNMGPILPKEGYLRELREITSKNDILLIFDEVITGFRLSIGGAQKAYGVKPDITTLGKIVGGGLPIGIFGASEEIMSNISPSGKVYQAGTFSGNPLSLTAGLETIKVLESEGYEGVNAKGEQLRNGLREILAEHHMDHQVQGTASMFQLFFSHVPVTDYRTAIRCDADKFMSLFHRLLDEGVYVPPSQFETGFLSTAHSDKDIKDTLNAFDRALGALN